jgi:prepilin-type N-terminal cleavage/methylation domain-containing protein/prepilin-type processing-associated H-X9-DG protein
LFRERSTVVSKFTSSALRRGVQRCPAFTLVELLVVIGIIAMLISILMPALTRARAAAMTAQCASNLRQVGQAFAIYASENDQYLPPAEGFDETVGANRTVRWWTTLVANNYLKGTGTVALNNNNKKSTMSGPSRLLQCPADATVDPNKGVEASGQGSSYVANLAVLSGANDGSSSAYHPPVKLVRVRNAATRIVLTEKRSTGNKWMVGLTSSIDPANPWMAQRLIDHVFGPHGGAGAAGRINVLFADFHVDTLPTQEVIQPAVDAVNGVSPVDPQELWGTKNLAY